MSNKRIAAIILFALAGSGAAQYVPFGTSDAARVVKGIAGGLGAGFACAKYIVKA
jgi:hypothetical protein